MSGQPGRWYELTTWADSEAVESVAELFARYGYNEGVSIEERRLGATILDLDSVTEVDIE